MTYAIEISNLTAMIGCRKAPFGKDLRHAAAAGRRISADPLRCRRIGGAGFA